MFSSTEMNQHADVALPTSEINQIANVAPPTSDDSYTILSSPTVRFSTLEKKNIVCLTDDNFMVWKFQISTAQAWYDMEDYLVDESSSSPKEICVNGVLTVNPLFQAWKRQDRIIFS